MDQKIIILKIMNDLLASNEDIGKFIKKNINHKTIYIIFYIFLKLIFSL